MSTIPSDPEAILEAFRALPLEEQRALAQQLVRVSLQAEEAQPHPSGWVSWRHLAGLFANGQEPPTDAQVERWIEEARTEKYGG